MFNATKALKKLDEIYDKSIIPSPVIKHIREILLAGQEDEPSKSTELNKACEEFYKGDGWKPLQSKAEGKTPDYLMGIEGKTPDYLTGGKPEKPVTEENQEEIVGKFSCPKCKFNASIVRRDGRLGMKDDKPSECEHRAGGLGACPDCMKSYKDIEDDRSFWEDVIYKDGKIDEEQVMKELSDYRFVMQQVSKVYDHVTGGKLSKIFYKAETIIAEADALFDKTFDENMREYLDDEIAKLDSDTIRISRKVAEDWVNSYDDQSDNLSGEIRKALEG